MKTVFKRKRLPYHGAGVLIWREGNNGIPEILLGKRSQNVGHGAGKWSTFGGKQERHESVYRCAMREAAEETGLQSEVLLDQEFFIFNPRPFKKRTIPFVYSFTYYSCEAIKAPKGWPRKNREHTEIGWFSVQQLPEPLHREARRVIKRWIRNNK